ncbi:glycosyltransferase [Caldovatus sediminis]|uniref:glycosyltransferase n=1 Tax=Caldovatus sediminis TaxID=2041189 RepID=UPI0016643B63|nr:glycosyltransferase [Caldovatus sediminis]
MTLQALHFCHSPEGGAGRAARRAVLACREAGVLATFACLAGASGAGAGELHLVPAAPASPGEAALRELLAEKLQWGVIPRHRTPLSNTLLSLPHPGVDPDSVGPVATADVLHLHWTSWMLTPRQVARWLAAGRTLVWTLHDFWPMTGGCHYPAGCGQWRTACLKCPQLDDEAQLVPNAFAEKRAGWGGAQGRLTVVAPSRWLAGLAAESAILGGAGARIAAIPNAVETDRFAPRPDREALRAAFGIGAHDLVLLFGSMDSAERRKGAAVLEEALGRALAGGRMAAALPPGGRVVVLLFGRSPPPIAPVEGLLLPLSLGPVAEDEVLADVLGIADLACVASLEENYPNVLVEALACGTPAIGFAAGGIPELIADGRTGVLVPEVGDAAALAEGLLRFARTHFRDEAMRAAARAQVLAENSPAVVGRRHRALYEEALEAGRDGRSAPRRGAAIAAELHARATRAFARAAVAPDLLPGPDFLRYPTNLLLRERAAAGAPATLAALAGCVAAPLPAPAVLGEGAAPVRRLLALRTHHAHHSAHSGPYQFLRHLPGCARIAVEAMTVPLGHAQAGRWAEPLRAAGRLLGLPAFGQQGNAWLAEAEVLARCVSPDAPSLVHFIDGELGGWLAPSLAAALAAAGARRPRMVATFHQPPALLEGMIHRGLLGALDRAVALCRPMRALLARHLPDERIVVIPHGVDADFFTPGPGAPAGASGAFRLLLVGHWLRDFDAALAALALLRAGGLDARLTVVSHNPPRQLAGTALPEGVTLRGNLSDAELRQAYRDADCLFLPLVDATANNAVLEAMACGRPVVSTDVGGVAEMTGPDAALLRPAGDAAALAEAVRALAADPGRAAAMGRAGRARAEALDWPRIAERHAALYDSLLAPAAGADHA